MLPLIFGLVSLLFLVIGWLIWKKERIDLLHDYHRHRVSEEDKKRFCALCGTGVGVIGIGMLLTAVLFAVTGKLWSLFAFVGGFLVGIVMLIWTIGKYNR